MKVLQLCNKPPYPPVDGGTMAMNSITQGLLSRGCEVKVLTVETVLPVDTEALLADAAEQEQAPEGAVKAGFEFEPSAGDVLDRLLPAYVRTTFYHALIDSAAGEQGARRAAMKSATDNANEMVETLTRIYNRARQSAITTEITEIVGGAEGL